MFEPLLSLNPQFAWMAAMDDDDDDGGGGGSSVGGGVGGGDTRRYLVTPEQQRVKFMPHLSDSKDFWAMISI